MSAYDDAVKAEFGIETEDWCRGWYVRHPEPRPARLAVRSYGLVTIIYMEYPVVESVDVVCDDCYQRWLEGGGEDPSFNEAARRSGGRVAPRPAVGEG
jgi:hypothetical protein